MPHRPTKRGFRTIREEHELKERLCAYRVMWLIISFDLPTVTPKQRKVYTVFRKNLLKDGFFMHQFSVYVRHCASFQHAETYINRVEKYIPKEGHVSIMQFTDKQFSMIKNYWGYGRSQPERFGQLTMFTEQTELQIK